MSISFHFDHDGSVRVYEIVNGYSSVEELMDSTRRFFEDFECPECGGHQCVGDYVGVVYRENRYYQEVEKTRTVGWIIRKKENYYTDEYVSSVWRIEGFSLRQRDGGFGIFSDESEGYLRCTREACNWEVRGGVKPSQQAGRYMSILDIDQTIKKSIYGFTNDATDADMVWDSEKRKYVGHVEL